MATGGLYGNTTKTVNTFFTWFIYQQSTLQPSTPTGGVWNFVANTGVPPSGWSNTPLTNPTNLVWVSVGFVNSQNPLSIQWSTPSQFSTAAAAASYPPAGIPNSTGASWTTSYGVTGTGSTIVLSASPTITGTANIANILTSGTLGVTGTSTLGVTTVTSPAYPDNTTRAVSSAYVLQATNAVSLPAMSATTVGLDLTNNGVSAAWSMNAASSQFLSANNGAF